MIGLLGAVWHGHSTVGVGIVHTEVEVQPQILETVNLIVELGIADETRSLGHIHTLIESGQRVDGGLGIRLERTVLHHIAPHLIAVQAMLAVDRLGRVVLNGGRDGSGIGEAVVLEHSLTVEGYGQMVVKEGRSQVQGHCSSLHAGGLQSTFLIEIASGHAVRHVAGITELEVALQTEICLMTHSKLIYSFLPVCIGIPQRKVAVGCLTAGISQHGCPHLISCHHIQIFGILGDRHSIIRAYMRYGRIVLASFLSGNDNHTVGCAGSVDGCRRCILENGKSLDIAGVDGRELVRDTAYSLIGDRQTVYHDQR